MGYNFSTGAGERDVAKLRLYDWFFGALLGLFLEQTHYTVDGILLVRIVFAEAFQQAGRHSLHVGNKLRVKVVPRDRERDSHSADGGI